MYYLILFLVLFFFTFSNELKDKLLVLFNFYPTLGSNWSQRNIVVFEDCHLVLDSNKCLDFLHDALYVLEIKKNIILIIIMLYLKFQFVSIFFKGNGIKYYFCIVYSWSLFFFLFLVASFMVFGIINSIFSNVINLIVLLHLIV